MVQVQIGLGEVQADQLSEREEAAASKARGRLRILREAADLCSAVSEGQAYNKGVRKSQFTGSYGDFKPVEVKSSGQRYPTDVVYFKTAESEGRVWHSTQKPVELGRYLIRTYSKEGDVVLDNAFGSGSFLVAAALEGRCGLGIELNESITEFKKQPLDLLEVAASRISEATGLSPLVWRKEKLQDHKSLWEKFVSTPPRGSKAKQRLAA